MKYLILGAGPAGLTLANRLLEFGESSVCVLEKESEAGGLCRTKYVEGKPLWNYEGGQNKYKFTIVFENHSKPGYASKLIWKAILSGSIPIYWGHRTFVTKLD